MTINLADNNPRIAYSVAQGATQQTFAVPFEFFNDSDLSVYVDGVLKAEGTDYTITGGDGSTGDVVFNTATPPDVQQVLGATGGSKVVIVRTTALERTSDFSAGADINRAALNEQLDILTAMAADLKDRADRTIQVNPHEIAPSLILPSLSSRKGKVLAFDETTGAVINGPTVDAVNDSQTYAAAAAASAAAASDSEDAAAASEAAAASSESHAASSEAASAASEAAAATSESNAAASESAAAASEAAAATSETNAASSASAASTSASNASSSASSASTSASNASAAQTAAEAARDATLTAYDNFDDRYLGSKTSDPSVDNDGNALVGGALYFNSTDGIMKLYNGTSWVAAYVSGAGFVAKIGGLTGAADVPAGTTGERPTPAAGYFRFNSTLGKFEGYSGTAWGSVGGGATGGGSDEVFFENGQTVTTNYTITDGKNAMSAGPITINSGVTVTIGTGEVWTIL